VRPRITVARVGRRRAHRNPHEERIDYPEGEACPQCPFWAGRDRFAGTPLPQDADDTDRAARAELLARLMAERLGHNTDHRGLPAPPF
jgi:hypothetical protein